MSRQSTQFEDILFPRIILAGIYSHTLVIIDKAVLPARQVKSELRNIQLSPVLEASAETPVLFEEQVAVYNFEPVENINRLGDFDKNILVLVNDPTSLHLAESELETLGKMLQALKLSFADIAIVNTANQEVTWQKLQRQLPAGKVILFGVDPINIHVPVRFPHFRVQKWGDTSFLYSPSLKEINRVTPEQQILKLALWSSIKELLAGK